MSGVHALLKIAELIGFIGGAGAGVRLLLGRDRSVSRAA